MDFIELPCPLGSFNMNTMNTEAAAALANEKLLRLERDKALLQLGSIQSVIAEELDLDTTPVTPDEVREVLRKAIKLLKGN